jgi:hypothetical protein
MTFQDELSELDRGWIADLLIDILLGDDFLTPHQRSLIGDIPEGVLRWLTGES